MISNQASAPANMGNLFQIFNLPKTGNTSYMFSDIIKVIGSEGDILPAVNLMEGSLSSDQSILDSTNLINLLVTHVNNNSALTPENGITGEKLYISEEELTAFLNKLGLEKASPAAQNSGEVIIEITPEFLNKLRSFINGAKAGSNNQFVTLDAEIFNKETFTEDTVTGSNPGKIKIIFKKVEDNDTVQQQLADTTSWQTTPVVLNPAKPEDLTEINFINKSSSMSDALSEKISSVVNANQNPKNSGKIYSEVNTQGVTESTDVKPELNLAAEANSNSAKPGQPANEFEKIITPDISGTAQEVKGKSGLSLKEDIIQNSDNSAKTQNTVHKQNSFNEILNETGIKEAELKAVKNNTGSADTETAELGKILSSGKTGYSTTVNEHKPVNTSSVKKEGIAKPVTKVNKEITVSNDVQSEFVDDEWKADYTTGHRISRQRPIGHMFNEQKIESKSHLKNGGDNQLYQISFEQPENSVKEKVLPQDFNTLDYEDFSSGIFSTKTLQSPKEKFVEIKLEEPVKNPVESVNGKSANENNDSSSEYSANNFSKDNPELTLKQQGRNVTESTFADHLNSRNIGSNDNISTKPEAPVKEYTSVFKDINSSELIDEVKKLIIKGEKSNITLKLTPEHLGTVKLTIDIKDSVMSTNIEVENESVKQTVQNNIENLKQTLQQNGIQLSSFSVSLSQQQEQKAHGKPQSKKKTQQETGEINIKDEIKTSAAKRMGYNTYEYLA